MLRLINNINKYAIKKQRSVKINHLIEYKKTNEGIINQSIFLHSELPIRLAHRIKDLESLPGDFIENKYLVDIHEQYVESFETLYNYKVPDNINVLDEFSSLLRDILDKHSKIHLNMYNCIKEYDKNKVIDDTLCKFYSSRIGIRFLMYHHVTENGIILDFSLSNILKNCIKNVDYITDRLCLDLDEKIKVSNYGETSSVLFIPDYLEYVVVEVVKNSVSAALVNSREIDINIGYLVSNNNISIKITDQSGGFNPLDDLYSFFYSDSKVSNKDLSGYGHGLGLSKLYIEYFGGYISINTLPGISTVCDIYIPSIIDNKENL